MKYLVTQWLRVHNVFNEEISQLVLKQIIFIVVFAIKQNKVNLPIKLYIVDQLLDYVTLVISTITVVILCYYNPYTSSFFPGNTACDFLEVKTVFKMPA